MCASFFGFGAIGPIFIDKDLEPASLGNGGSGDVDRRFGDKVLGGDVLIGGVTLT